jgi:RNA polymerase sigma factor (sigma-70 family)
VGGITRVRGRHVAEVERPDIERLYRQHRAGLVRLIEREVHDRQDAEDVVQTAFLDAQRALERGTIPHNPRAWLAAIALNAARRLWHRQVNVEALEEYAAHEASRLPELKAALADLSQNEQAAVLYRDLLGLSYAETAEQMSTTVPAVTMLLHRARSRLRTVLGSAVVGVGLSRWLRGGEWQATAAKAGAVVLAGGLGTAGALTAVHTVGAIAPRAAAPAIAPRTATPAVAPRAATPAIAAPRRRREADRGSHAVQPRSRANHIEHPSRGSVHTEQSSTGAVVNSVTAPAVVQIPASQTAPSSPPPVVPSTSSTPSTVTVAASSLQVPTVQTAPLPTIPSATITAPVTTTLQTPIATVTVSVP